MFTVILQHPVLQCDVSWNTTLVCCPSVYHPAVPQPSAPHCQDQLVGSQWDWVQLLWEQCFSSQTATSFSRRQTQTLWEGGLGSEVSVSLSADLWSNTSMQGGRRWWGHRDPKGSTTRGEKVTRNSQETVAKECFQNSVQQTCSPGQTSTPYPAGHQLVTGKHTLSPKYPAASTAHPDMGGMSRMGHHSFCNKTTHKVTQSHRDIPLLQGGWSSSSLHAPF